MSDRVFTPAELQQFDGQHGLPAYVAVRGLVYDVTGVPQWRRGKHHGNTAGQDYTADYPHEEEWLERLPVVGRLAEALG